MIDEALRPVVPRPPARRRRRGAGWLAVFVLATLVTSGFLVGRHLQATALPAGPSGSPSAPPPTPPASPATAPVLESAPMASSAPVRTTPPAAVLSLPGAIPAKGSGAFVYASGRGEILGTKGPLRRFRVAVERGSAEDLARFTSEVTAILGDTRGWTGGGSLRLQQVSGADAADFTVYLATRETAGRMCAQGGTNIRVGGRPYTSCRTAGKAIINLDRWRLSAQPYLTAKVPLTVYRQYVINHEVGHELGHRHQNCPRAGGPAPVMVQQTLTTRGCRPYGWPRHGKGFLTGPNR